MKRFHVKPPTVSVVTGSLSAYAISIVASPPLWDGGKAGSGMVKGGLETGIWEVDVGLAQLGYHAGESAPHG
jgi:hypothetical protein